MGQNEVTIKGIVEPDAICMKIMKKTKRMAKVLSPLPAADGEPLPEVVASQVSIISKFLKITKKDLAFRYKRIFISGCWINYCRA